jgi:ATP-binding cassette subfamily B protein IrtA
MARRGFQGAVLRSLGAQDHELTVVRKQHLAPHFVQIWFTSPTLFNELDMSPTAWIRFWFPDPAGSETQFQRGYTIAHHDEITGEFAVNFVLHEPAGPASTWAKSAQPGDAVAAVVLGTHGFEIPENPPAGYLLIGDSASLPAINSIIEVVPPEIPIELYLEKHSIDDESLPLVDHPRLVTRWVERQGADSLADAIELRDWSNWFAWVTPESASLKRLRTKLRDECGFPKAEMHPQAYWVEGKAMGKSRAADAPENAQENVALADVRPAEQATDMVAGGAGGPPAPPATTHPSMGEEDGGRAVGTEENPAASPPKGAWQADAQARLLAPMKRVFWTAGVLQGLVTILQLVPYVLLVELARRLLAGAPSDQLASVGILAAILLGVSMLLESALLLWLHTVDARFESDLRAQLLRKLARVPLGWFTARSSGRVKKLVQDDPLSLHYLLTHAVPDAVAAVVAPLAVLAYLFAVDWRLALIMFVPVLVYIVSMYAMMVASGAKMKQAQHWAQKMNSEAASYLDAQPVVRVFGGAAASTFQQSLARYIQFLNDWQRPFTRKKTIMDLATRPATFLWLLALFGTLFIVRDTLDPVNLLPFLLLGTTFGTRLLGIGYGLSGIRDGMNAARDLQTTLEEKELTVVPPSADAAPGVGKNPPVEAQNSGTVEFDRVTFSYRHGVPVLEDVTLTLMPGTMTALVGPSGSGKSTLAGLLARFHDIDSGTITISGRDIRTLTADELYAQVGFVFQDTQIVQGTVAENIALARPSATATDIEQAAHQAQIHERITKLPDGYDTVLSGSSGLGDGVSLSGGEQQRLTIARAILADTPILILDEATAFADPESESLVQQALSSLTADRTVLVIAHRLRTITHADQIVVLEGGRIVEKGTHNALLEQGGRYGELWQAGTSQSEGAHNPTLTTTGLEGATK